MPQGYASDRGPTSRLHRVPGGGVTLLRARKVLTKLRTKLLNEDEITGLDILHEALVEPLKRIVRNAGENDSLILEKIEKEAIVDYGFNVMTRQYGSMIKAGIVDPAKVTRSAVQNAASVGMMVLTTEALITDIPEKDKAPQMPGGMGGMDY